MNSAELHRAMITAKDDVDNALRQYENAIIADANADRKMRIAKSTAYLASSGTAGERAAHTDKAAIDEIYQARLAEGLKRSAGQAVEAKRQWLSALQSLSAADRAEAQLARWESRETA